MQHRAPLLLVCALALGCNQGPEGAGHVKERLLASVPIESSSQQVMHYLDSQKINHTTYGHEEGGGVVGASLPDKAQYASSSAIIKTDFSLDFHFDNHDRLTALKVTEKYTGP
jgi:hypothetical protein